ncbi:hypothetical protein ACJX0J_023966, partial [Zea mays]
MGFITTEGVGIEEMSKLARTRRQILSSSTIPYGTMQQPIQFLQEGCLIPTSEHKFCEFNENMDYMNSLNEDAFKWAFFSELVTSVLRACYSIDGPQEAAIAAAVGSIHKEEGPKLN